MPPIWITAVYGRADRGHRRTFTVSVGQCITVRMACGGHAAAPPVLTAALSPAALADTSPSVWNAAAMLPRCPTSQPLWRVDATLAGVRMSGAHR